MPLREDILEPIAGENPSGVDIRYDSELLLYDKIKEARRQDDELAQGEWQHERKVADFAVVINLAQEGLATRTKDLQLAAWLTEGAASYRRICWPWPRFSALSRFGVPVSGTDSTLRLKMAMPSCVPHRWTGWGHPSRFL